jgi:DNA-directed RNA polymerase specialized sigma24 family protein
MVMGTEKRCRRTVPMLQKGVGLVVDWFERHKHGLYMMGWSFLGDEEQVEELFYRCMEKADKEWHRFNKEITFDLWVLSIFIQTCREISMDKRLPVSEKREHLDPVFEALLQLKQDEKEAVALIFLQGLSRGETAQVLGCSEEKSKELLFSSIQSLRGILGENPQFNGCREYHPSYIDYLERTLERREKVDFEVHIFHCQHCQEDLATFQEVMIMLRELSERAEVFPVPASLMQNVEARMAEKEQHRQRKNQQWKRLGIVFAGVFAFIVALEFFTGVFSSVYYAWTEEDHELRAFLQQDLGENLNLAAESNGVKIRIKSVIADDAQTLVFYEIEDIKEENQYMISLHDGAVVENETAIMNHNSYPRFYPPDLQSDVNKKAKNVFHGKISLLPLTTDEGTIELKITKLQKLKVDALNEYDFRVYGDGGNKTGEWNFEIPAAKQPSKEYALTGTKEVEGIPVRFDKLTISPTATILQFGINQNRSQKRLDVLNFKHLEVNGHKLKADMFGSSHMYEQRDMDWTVFQAYFDPLFGEKPENINAQFDYVHLGVDDQKTIDLEAYKEYPQTFEYAGSTISIEKVDVGDPTIIVLSDHEIRNRAYQSFHFDVVGEDGIQPDYSNFTSEGVIVDKNGAQYDMEEMNVPYEEIEQPLHFTTVQSVAIDNNVVPKSIVIHGYNSMKYLDDVVEIKVDE